MCHLPCNGVAEGLAFDSVITYLKSLRHGPLGVQGFTYSEPLPTAFYGYWWSDDRKKWIRDNIVLLIIDYNTDEVHSVSAKISELKAKISECYRQEGSAQDAVWVVMNKATRHA